MKLKYKNQNIIGVDETGVGDYFTPLVSCALFVTYENALKLEKLGVTDSKKISDNQIMALASQIKKISKYSISFLSTKAYNTFNRSFNANELKMFIHMQSINKLEEKVKADLIILDQFSTPNSIKKYYQKLGGTKNLHLKQFKTKFSMIERGEMEHVAVAAASVLAREKMLYLMKDKEKKLNIDLPLGTNLMVEKVAKEILKIYGEEVFKDQVKLSFKTTKKILEENND